MASEVVLDVVIIGGGLSGLSAAHCLAEKDPSLNIRVLEASDRVGGRLMGHPLRKANADETEMFDIGGQWILPHRHKDLMQLIDRLGLRCHSNPVGSDCGLKNLTQLGKRSKIRDNEGLSGIRMWLKQLEVTYIVWKLNILSKKISLSGPYWSTADSDQLDAITVHTYLEQNCRFQSTKDYINIKLSYMTGFDASSVSLLFLLTYAVSNAKTFSDYYYGVETDDNGTSEIVSPNEIIGGAFNICDRLVGALKDNVVHLNQPVQEVVRDLKIVHVICKTGEVYKCKKVICAIPPNVVKCLEFTPALSPAKTSILSNMRMGATLKFILTYDDTYWQSAGYSGLFLSNGGIKHDSFLVEGDQPMNLLCDGTTYNGVPALVGFIGGKLAVQWSSLGLQRTKNAILESLAGIFGTWAKEPCDFIIKDWSDEPFIGGGSIATPSVGSMHAFHVLKEPHGPVHFAGTETAANFYGTMAGALEAGQRSAIEVLDELRPQALSSMDYVVLRRTISMAAQARTPSASDAEHVPVSGKPKIYVHVFRWTLMLPLFSIGLAYSVVRLRDRYAQLLIPTI